MTPSDKELLRHAILDCLVLRHPVALTPQGIRRRVATELDIPVELPDVEAALAILHGMAPPLAQSTPDHLGATTYWSATSAGVLHIERSS